MRQTSYQTAPPRNTIVTRWEGTVNVLAIKLVGCAYGLMK